MKRYRMDNVAQLKQILDKFSDDARVEVEDDAIIIYTMINHLKYDSHGYIIADDWRKSIIAEITI